MTAPGQRAYSLRLTCVGFLLLVASCASTKKATIPVDKSQSEIEQFLLLPIRQGHAGVDQVVRNLQRHYGVDDATSLSARTNASKAITLDGGSVIEQAFTGTRTHAPDWNEVAFDLEAKPCLHIERAAMLTGATKVDESGGSDTVRASVTYQFRNNAVRMDITAYAPNLQCVGTVWVYKITTPKVP